MAKPPQFLKSRLRLFLSADIVGSTALKQTPRDALSASTLEWFPILQGFYIETQRAFLSEWDRSVPIPAKGKESQVHWGPRPEFWKVIGDEILFTKELTDSHQLANVLSCWIIAIDATRKFIRGVDSRLDVKCTAWTAGFPLVNKEVALPRKFEPADEPVTDYFKEGGRLLNERYRLKNDVKIAVDYIGPSIDIGFRLAQFATSRKLVISVGVAYILSLRNREAAEARTLRFRYDGSVVLKGVYGGTRYPLFWIDLALPGDLALLEDKLVKPVDCTADDVHKYCEKFYQETSHYTFKPFIASPSETELTVPPDDYAEAIDKLRKSYALEIIGDPASEQAAEAETPPKGQAVGSTPPVTPAAPDDETPLSVSKLDFTELFEAVLRAGGSGDPASITGKAAAKAVQKRPPIGEKEEDED